MVDVVSSSLQADLRLKSLVRRLPPKVGSRLALFCIHRVNRINSRNDSESWWQHHKHCPGYYYYYYSLTSTIRYPHCSAFCHFGHFNRALYFTVILVVSLKYFKAKDLPFSQIQYTHGQKLDRIQVTSSQRCTRTCRNATILRREHEMFVLIVYDNRMIPDSSTSCIPLLLLHPNHIAVYLWLCRLCMSITCMFTLTTSGAIISCKLTKRQMFVFEVFEQK